MTNTITFQLLFVLNGKPSRIYRAVLNPVRAKTFDALLQEVSEGLNVRILYSLIITVAFVSLCAKNLLNFKQ